MFDICILHVLLFGFIPQCFSPYMTLLFQNVKCLSKITKKRIYPVPPTTPYPALPTIPTAIRTILSKKTKSFDIIEFHYIIFKIHHELSFL